MSETTNLLPEWAAFHRDYVETGIPHLIVVRENPVVALFLDQNADRLGARFEQAAPRSAAPLVPLAEIHVDDVVGDSRRLIEIWTDARHLFGNFYRLLSEVAAEVVNDSRDPDSALAAAVSRWDALLSRPALMSEETQAGLFGELWLLERLISVHGPEAVEAWVGPVRQPHDFRFGDIELEVKTTSGAKRIHMINGVGQLQASLDCRLYLLSLKLANAGAGGRTLAETVDALEASLAGSADMLQRFRTALTAVGYDPLDSVHYPRRRRLRDAAMLIPIDDGVPRLTDEALAGVERRFAPDRITSVTYAIDVEGLGVSDNTEAFLAVLPAFPSPPEFPDV